MSIAEVKDDFEQQMSRELNDTDDIVLVISLLNCIEDGEEKQAIEMIRELLQRDV